MWWRGGLAPPITVIPFARPVPRREATRRQRARRLRGTAAITPPRVACRERRRYRSTTLVVSVSVIAPTPHRRWLSPSAEWYEGGRGRRTMGWFACGAAGEGALRRLVPPLQPLPSARRGGETMGRRHRVSRVRGAVGGLATALVPFVVVRSGAGGPRWTLNAFSHWRRSALVHSPPGLRAVRAGRVAGRQLVRAAQGQTRSRSGCGGMGLATGASRRNTVAAGSGSALL